MSVIHDHNAQSNAFDVFRSMLSTQCAALLTLALFASTTLAQVSPASALPNQVILQFLKSNCGGCHGKSLAEGDFRLEQLVWDLTDEETRAQWTLVRRYVATGAMPPKEASTHPSKLAIEKFVNALEAEFERAAEAESHRGTPLRRLNRIEYLNTVRDLFGIRMLKLPASFPQDATDLEFDTMPAGLFLSPALMEAYHQVATDIASRLVPLDVSVGYQRSMTVEEIGGDNTRRWFGSNRDHLKMIGVNHSGWAGALWDALFVAPQSGRYRIRMHLRAQAAQGADGQPLRMGFYVFDPTEEQLPKRYLRHRAAHAGTVEVTNDEFQWIDCDVQIEAGETFHLYCENRFAAGTFPDLPLNRSQVNKHVKAAKQRQEPTVEVRAMHVEGPFDVPKRVKDFLGEYPPTLKREQLEQKLLPLADRVYRRPLTQDEKLRLIESTLQHGAATGSATQAWHYAIRRLLCSPSFLYHEAEAMALPFEHGPLVLTSGAIHPPAGRGATNERGGAGIVAQVGDTSHPFSSPDPQLAPAKANSQVGRQTPEHQKVPFSASSVGFSTLPERKESFQLLNSYAVASRLSYALWSTMPDAELRQLADNGQLANPITLKAQIQRLIADRRSSQFVKHFSGQWLGNRAVASINVCDNRYAWDDNVRHGFLRATEMFFAEILQENLPIATFVDSDFTYANNAMRYVWGFRGKDQKNLQSIAADQRQSLIWPEPERLQFSDLPEDAPQHVKNRGGVLGLPGVLTVTGDGVESSPILRGVWVLENLFGMPPPPPPKDVPAIDIDTSQTTSVRETLAAHQQLDTCAACHRDIDPLGLALENYDAMGGWRDAYVGEATKIDATAVMPDGTELDGPSSIKAYLMKNRSLFTRCLLTKLLEYSTGRILSVADQKVVGELVASEPEAGYRFRDLVEISLTSEVFLRK